MDMIVKMYGREALLNYVYTKKFGLMNVLRKSFNET